MAWLDFLRKKRRMLFGAIAQRDITLVESLLAGGVSPNGRYDSVTSLQCVFSGSGRIEVGLSLVQLLVKRGASIDGKDSDGDTSVHWAATCLLDDWEDDRRRYLTCLLELGGDVNARNRKGDTPLHKAAMGWPRSGERGSSPALISTLLDHGADVEAVNREGLRPLHSAALFGNALGARQLVESGAGVDAQEETGTTALMFAAIAGKLEVVKALVACDADLSLESKKGLTAARAGLAFDRGDASGSGVGKTISEYLVTCGAVR